MSANTFPLVQYVFFFSPADHPLITTNPKTAHCHKQQTHLIILISILDVLRNKSYRLYCRRELRWQLLRYDIIGFNCSSPRKREPVGQTVPKTTTRLVRPMVVMAAAWWYKKHEINQILIINYHADWTRALGCCPTPLGKDHFSLGKCNNIIRVNYLQKFKNSLNYNHITSIASQKK